jgi:uncharacterized protein
MPCDHAGMTVPSLQPGSYQLLFYDYVPDILARRDPYRSGHLEHARAAKERGELLNVGAVGSPPVGAVFVFADIDPAAIETYAAADAYVMAGLVTDRRVEPWTVVV